MANILAIGGLSLALAAVALPGKAQTGEGLTLKERLSDKASDQQRVDNCRVPVERRGPKPRPDCRDDRATTVLRKPEAKPSGGVAAK